VSRDKALEHYRRALTLHPASAIARIEYAWGLVSMFGQSRIDEATRLVVDAAHVEPADAMERLDVALAESRLEEG
jgi:tetratricopeptide (TPR) repeat protein